MRDPLKKKKKRDGLACQALVLAFLSISLPMTRPLDDSAQAPIVMAALGGSKNGKKPHNSGSSSMNKGGRAPHASTPAAAASVPPQSSMARGFARLDPETTAYFTEARETLENLLKEGDREQASLLAGAALREAASPSTAAGSSSSSKATTSDVIADAVASRALESFLLIASSADVLSFAQCVLADPETLGNVALR